MSRFLFALINASSSSLYVLRLQYSRVFHCRIVSTKSLKASVAFETKKTPKTRPNLQFKTQVQKSLAIMPGGMLLVVNDLYIVLE